MCLAVPMKVIAIRGDEAEVESAGTTYTASILLTPEVKVGDYVLLHTGYSISILEKDEAEERLALFQQLEECGHDEK